MSTEFLDKTGLAYFWGKIKAYVASVLAGMVHIAGSETITGSKTFTSNVKLDNAALDVYASGTVGGTAVSQHDYAVQAQVANPVSNGPHFLLGGRSSTIVRAGEGGATYFADFEGDSQESVVLIADGLMRFITNADTYENRKIITLNTYGSFSGLNDVEAVTFTGALNGNASTATLADKATKDGSGNVITSKYVTLDTTQTISGTKTFTSAIKLDNAALTVYASETIDNVDISQHDWGIAAEVASSGSNGPHFLYGGKSGTVIRAGESGETLWTGLKGATSESIYLVADGLIYFVVGANTYANRKTITLNTYGSLSGLNDVSAVSFTGDLSGNATSASKLASNFTISLSGDASGSVSTNGTGTATISVAVVDDSHNHVISNVDGLQSALNAKAADSGVVHNTGDETIDGTKTFYASTRTTSTFVIVNNNVDMRNAPSDTNNKYVYFEDTRGYAIGVIQSRAAATSNSIRLKIRKYGDTSTSTAGLVDVGLYYNVSANDYSFAPSTNGSMRLGGSSGKWSEVFASTGSINTSDVRLKTDIAYIPDEVLAVWETVPFYQFKFKSAVADKGEAARLHSGLLAQDIRDRFAGAGLDASRYGLFCHDSWDAQEAEYDSDGNLEYEAKPAGDEYALRYEEALCMEAACQRRRAERLEARVAALEARLSAAGL